jgi:hypothetical protein
LLFLSNSVFGQSPADDVDRRFAALKSSFQTTANASFGQEAVSSWNVASAYVAKAFLVRSLSAGVANAGIVVSVTLPRGSFGVGPPPGTDERATIIYTDKIDEPKCDAERGCNSNCDWYDFDCIGKKIDCERLKAIEKGACELKKSVQGSLSHKKLLELFLYDYDQGYDGGADTVNISGNASAKISGIKLNDDLTKADLLTTVTASALVSAKTRIKLEPAIKGVLLAITLNPGCLIDQDYKFKDQSVNVDEPHLDLPISIAPPSVEGNHIKVDLRFEKTTILLHFDRSPIARLFESQVGNFLPLLACPLPISTVLVAEEFFPNDMMKKEQELPPMSNAQTIASIHSPIFGEDYVLTPVVTPKAWGVKAERNQR